MPTDNHCWTCRHFDNKDGGHCYLFKSEPRDQCLQHTGKIDAWEKLKKDRKQIKKELARNRK